MVQNSSALIHFHYLTTPFHFTGRKQLKAFLVYLFRKEGFKINSLNYIFCSDKYLNQLNKKHLNHDNYTDILTFDLSDKGKPTNAEIYISIDRVKENASIYKTSFKKELLRVIFHGALHLCGYKDKSKKQTQQMRMSEEYYLTRYFVSRETKLK